MAFIDGCCVPCWESLQLFIDPGNRGVLSDVGQFHQAARQVITALAVFSLLLGIEIIAGYDVDGFFQQGQVAQTGFIVVVQSGWVFFRPCRAQFSGGCVRQNMLDFKSRVRQRIS